jgi:predicted transposase YdaD
MDFPLSRRKKKASKDSKQYDSLVKALFGEQSEEIIASLIAEVQRPEGLTDDELNVELNRTTLSIDIGRHLILEGEAITLNLEAQARANEDLLPRMDEYRINLYRRYKRPVLSVALLLFACEAPQVPFQIICGGKVRSAFYPIIICLWEKDPYQVVANQQRCLYTLLPAMKGPSAELLLQAVQEMDEHDSPSQFKRHLAWFQTMLRRTTTVSPQDKHKVEEALHMQYQGFALFREDPVIGGMISEGERKGELKGKIKGEIKGLREAILDIADDLFSLPAAVQVQQAIAPVENAPLLRNFLRQLVQLSDEEELPDLLAECFPLPEDLLPRMGEIQGLQEAILDVVGDRFSSQVTAQVQQAIAPVQDVPLLRKFHRQLVQLSDEQDVSALLAQLFPDSEDAQ